MEFRLFGLQKGNPENLEGRVLAYVSIPKSEEKSIYPAIYAVLDPSDLNLFKFHDQENSDIEEIKESHEKAKRFLKGFKDLLKKELNIDADPLPVLPNPGHLHSLDEINDIKVDVLYGGTILESNLIPQTLHALVTLYMANYKTQIENKIVVPKVESKVVDNIKNYRGEELKIKMYHYIGNLMDQVINKNVKDQAECIADIRTFTKGSSYLKDVANIIHHAQLADKKDIDLITLYVNKMCAVSEEKYEEARKIKEKIERIIGSS